MCPTHGAFSALLGNLYRHMGGEPMNGRVERNARYSSRMSSR